MLYLLRHGATKLNQNKIAQGNNTDEGLTIEGKRQVSLAAKEIIFWGASPREIMSSPAKRSLETATLLHSNFPNTVMTVEECLRERDLGNFEGLSKEELLAERSRRRIRGKNPWLDWDGAKDVESDHSIYLRISQLLTRCKSVGPFAQNDFVWVTHSGVIKSFIRYSCGIHGGYTRLYIGCGGIVRIWQEIEGSDMTIDQIYNPTT